MSTLNHKHSIRQQFKKYEADMRALFREHCDPLPLTPDDEYDCLIDQVLSLLERETTQAEVEKLVSSEFSNHFGLTVDPNETIKVSSEIIKWWQQKISAQ
jgi:hypothetical protein